MTINERITAARKYAGLTKTQMARGVGISPQAMGQLENGETKQPKPSTLFKIAEVCNVNAHWIATGEGKMVNTYINTASGSFPIGKAPDISESSEGYSKNRIPTVEIRRVPVLTKKQLQDREKTLAELNSETHDQWETTDSLLTDDAFAIIMEGNTMMYPGDPKSIPPGATLFIDPHLKPDHGDIVIALDQDSVLIKQLEIDGPNRYLKSINPTYQIIPMTSETQILGVAVDVKYKLR